MGTVNGSYPIPILVEEWKMKNEEGKWKKRKERMIGEEESWKVGGF